MNGAPSPTPDETGILAAIGEKDRQVHVHFSRKTDHWVMDPDNAKTIAEEIAKSAYTAQFGRAPDGGPRSMVTESLRMKMRARARIVIRSLTEQGKGTDYIADNITDIILRELA